MESCDLKLEEGPHGYLSIQGPSKLLQWAAEPGRCWVPHPRSPWQKYSHICAIFVQINHQAWGIFLQIWVCFGYGKDGGLTVSTKRDNFVRLAEARVTRAIDAMRVIGNLSNRSNYEYNEEDVKTIINTLQTELTALKAQFKTRPGMSAQGFRLKK